ncbi:MAG: hypothetical protein IPL53_14965 [Ignavibacteria bacterium]|nr:hypothetical protein [Ignavibacteria bacterium]
MIINYIKQCGHKKFFRSVVYVLIITFSLTASGCYSTHVGNVRPDSLKSGVSYTMIKAIMKDGTILDLRGKEATYAAKYQDQRNVILFKATDTTLITPGVFNTSSKVSFLRIKDIQTLIIEKEEMNTAMTIVAVVAIAAVFAVIIALIISASKDSDPPPPRSSSSSCPFIYSFNGENYIFDGEPYGGAITEGLKKTDYSKT